MIKRCVLRKRDERKERKVINKSRAYLQDACYIQRYRQNYIFVVFSFIILPAKEVFYVYKVVKKKVKDFKMARIARRKEYKMSNRRRS